MNNNKENLRTPVISRDYIAVTAKLLDGAIFINDRIQKAMKARKDNKILRRQGKINVMMGNHWYVKYRNLKMERDVRVWSENLGEVVLDGSSEWRMM
jgi:hypothetical protein